jgi:arabinofuranosyltransferase
MPAGLARIRRLRPPEARVPVGSWVGGTALLVTAGWLLVSLTPIRSPYDNQRRFFQDVRSDAVRLTGSQHPTTAGLWAHAFRDQDQKISWTLRSGSPVLLAFGVDAQLHPVSFDPGRQRSPRPVTLVAARLGTTGASTPLDLTIIDQLSLASPLGAHLQLHRGVWPGHEKLLSNAWILADAAAPDATIPNQIAFGLAPGDPAAARRALTCGELAELQDSVRAPLTASRFWHNLVGAPRRTALRIPRDPSAAEREFCH